MEANKGDMSKKLQFQGQWGDQKNTVIECRLQIIFFEEDGNVIAFSPHLDLSGYGKNEEEAKASWEIALNQYFDYSMAKNSLATDLRKLGWEIKKTLRKKITPPEMSYLLDNNEDFKEIFNNHDYKQQQTTVGIPALV